jgi:hypothetical protein
VAMFVLACGDVRFIELNSFCFADTESRCKEEVTATQGI